MPIPRAQSESGQVVAVVMVMLLVLATLVPAMVLYTQREARWTEKLVQNTNAFHLAETGIEKALRVLSLSSATWNNLQNNGTPVPGFQFDVAYSDLDSGDYAVHISSGPGVQQATIISVGRDSSQFETRALQAIYTNATLGDMAVFGVAGVNVSGNNLTVEWGAIVSPNSITTNSENHPSYWSAGGIDLDTNGATLPNCDYPNCWRWHSYYPIVATPSIDFEFYKSSAVASGSGPCGAYYVDGNKSGTCNDTSGKSYYVTGNWTDFDGPVRGTIIVLGNMTTPNGVMSPLTAYNAKVPTKAWRQYCNDWSYYVTNYHPTSPYTTACPGLQSTYESPTSLTYSIAPIIQGLLYVGGDFTGPNGGGNTEFIHGVIFVKGTAYLNSNSHVKVYYDSAAAAGLVTSTIVLTRSSWKDVTTSWPSGL